MDLIAKVEETRNHPLYSQFASHTDLYDSVLLALGRDVAKVSLQPMPAWRARALAARSGTDLWDEVAPALTDIFHNGPPPAPKPTLDNPLPTSINLSIKIEPTHLTLTDYFGHETNADLTFTVALDNPIATITQWDELISIKNTSKGTATMTVTASDGTHSVSATAGLEAACSPTSRLSSDGTFCVSPQVMHTYSGAVPPYPSSPPSAGTTGIVRLTEGTSGQITVRVYPDLGHSNNACRMNGYITIEPQTPGQTIPTGVTAATVGMTSSPSSAGQGWSDGSCSYSYLTTNDRNHRLARISYTLGDDGTPGTGFNGAKLVYHDVVSGSVVDTHDLVTINFRDSIASVTMTANSGEAAAGEAATATNIANPLAASDFTITEGTSGTQTITLSGEHLVGYLAPRMEDIRKKSNGRAGHFTRAHMRLEHGHAVYWQPSVCALQPTGV